MSKKLPKFFFRFCKLSLLFLMIAFFSFLWFASLVVFFILLYNLAHISITRIGQSKLKKIAASVFNIAYFILLSITIKLFLADVYKIPSDSMENTFFPEDIILVNKMISGAAIPRDGSAIPWINFFFKRMLMTTLIGGLITI